MPEYRGAVLIVGSLWWDIENETRANWQKHSLEIAKAKKVFAPIRYGKLSETRSNTYTMVFSQSCSGDRIGKALLVPFQKSITTIGDLKIEAQELWKAEGGISDRIAGTWGAVGLLVNPESNLPAEMIDRWKSLYKGQRRKPDFKPIGDEPSSLSDDGMLMLQWLEDVENKKVTEFDFILATATLPNVQEYPSADVIAQACSNNHYTEYFDKNQAHGITTFQDEEILKLLHPNK